MRFELSDRTVLVTGACGYIGSHAVLFLLQNGFRVVAIDNLSNSTVAPIHAIEKFLGKSVRLVIGDIASEEVLTEIFENNQIEGVFHFAGLKSVKASVEDPVGYYKNNVEGTLNLIDVMASYDVKRLVFSSSATVYGDSTPPPVAEDTEAAMPINPYGKSKLFCEEILKDLWGADSSWCIAILRYFNPVGAHPSGIIGESPRGIPDNLVPYVAQVALGVRSCLDIYGNDYPTPDGTGVRDYIHVCDLVEGHLAAYEYIDKFGGVNVWNLGTGKGCSVLDVVKVFSEVSGKEIKYRFAGRRSGDIAASWASCEKAEKDLHWKAERTLVDMINDGWRWSLANNSQ